MLPGNSYNEVSMGIFGSSFHGCSPAHELAIMLRCPSLTREITGFEWEEQNLAAQRNLKDCLIIA